MAVSVSFSAVAAEGGRAYVPAADPVRPLWDAYGLNWANGNARAVLGLLGLQGAADELWGEASIPDCRRAVMQARARFERRAGDFVREGGTISGRIFVTPLDRDDLAGRIDAFAAYVEAAAASGAAMISWG